MIYYLIKIFITALVIIAVSELSKRHTMIAGVLASIPLVSVLAFVWLYHETENSRLVINLCKNIFWLVLPSLTLFFTLPIFLEGGLSFYLSLALSIAITVLSYGLMLAALNHFGIGV